jgi:putative transposase
MRRRRTPDEVARLLREADRDLAKGQTVSDVCRKQGIAETTYYQWRQQHAPDQADTDRRCRELQHEVDRLNRMMGRQGQVTGIVIQAKSSDPAVVAGLRHRIESENPGVAVTPGRDQVQRDVQL